MPRASRRHTPAPPIGGLGAAAPIVLLSRSDSAEIKLLSLALGTLHDEQEIASRRHRPFFG